MFLGQFRAGGESSKGPVVTAQEAQAQAILAQARVCTLFHIELNSFFVFCFLVEMSVLGAENVLYMRKFNTTVKTKTGL